MQPPSCQSVPVQVYLGVSWLSPITTLPVPPQLIIVAVVGPVTVLVAEGLNSSTVWPAKSPSVNHLALLSVTGPPLPVTICVGLSALICDAAESAEGVWVEGRRTSSLTTNRFDPLGGVPVALSTIAAFSLAVGKRASVDSASNAVSAMP